MKKIIYVIFIMCFVGYLFILANFLFRGVNVVDSAKSISWNYVKSSANFSPCDNILGIINDEMALEVGLKNILINLFMFFPLGVFIPMFVKEIDKWNWFLIFAIVVNIVLITYNIVSMRSGFNLEYFLLNIIGSIMGFAIWRIEFVQKILNIRYGNRSRRRYKYKDERKISIKDWNWNS